MEQYIIVENENCMIQSYHLYTEKELTCMSKTLELINY